MITLIVIFVAIYVWRDVKDDYKPFFAALFGLCFVLSELLTGAALINMAGDFLGGLIL